MRRKFVIGAALLTFLAWAAPAPAAPCPTSGLGSGSLPDCRVYEQVSPVDKNAYEAGSVQEVPRVTFASPDGSRVIHWSTGAMGESEAGLQPMTLATRSATGWQARNAFPRPENPQGVGFSHTPRSILPSADLSSIFFWAGARWLPQVPFNPENSGDGTSTAAYLLREGQPLQWVTEPRAEDTYGPAETTGAKAYFRPRPAGASPNLDRVYFNYLGTLLPGEEPRLPYAEADMALGVFEYEEGVLRNAGTLPDGTLDPMGAAAAGSIDASIGFLDNTSPETANNQVSADGRTLWFVSPDPTPDRGRVVQLYVRANGVSELVSRSELTDQPAASGVRPVPHAVEFATVDSYVFAAADGSRAFFQSADRLTADAPDDATQKTYLYDVAGDDLVYLPELNGALILEGSGDGSRLLLLNAERTRLELWVAGSGSTLVSETSPFAYSPGTRATVDGSVFAFTLSGELPGFPNPNGLPQAYRYEVASGDLDCVSCSSAGPPSSEAVISRDFGPVGAFSDGYLRGMRGVSADGRWVFFDTEERLVPADTNGRRDAYRWSEEDGARLISSGRSGGPSFMMDVSADGATAFFNTKEGISPLDIDGSYDVYAAKIGGGFPSTELPACEGSGCRGSVAAPPARLDPVTKSLRGRGNVEPGPRRSTTRRNGLAARLNGRGGKLRLRVSPPAAGRVVVSGPRVQPLKRRIAKPGAYVLRPHLKPSAREALKQRGRLMVRVKVRFLPREGRASSGTIATEVAR